MQARLIRLRFRRGLRQRQRLVEDLGTQAEENIEQHLLKRFDRLANVKRFVGAWLGLLVLLIGGLIAQNINLSNYFQSVGSIPGGIYSEGILGRFTNANPMYATSDADATVSRLIFAGLLTYDNQGKLVGDLASSYTVDGNGKTYTVHLHPNLKWQDGQPLTSADVVFTYQSIENPDTQSPLFSSWQGIDVSAPNSQTVVFKLPDPLASFPYNMTNGIVPKHLLADTPAAELRSADFNTLKPVGAGPFTWQGVQVSGNDPAKTQEQIGLVPFKDFHGGAPKLQKFIVKVYASKKDLADAFKANQITALEDANDMNPNLKKVKGAQSYNMLLRAANMVFFKTTSGVLSDKSVRKALVQSVDVNSIINKLDYPTHAVREPILTGQLGYDSQLMQPGYNLKAAKQTLASDGWQKDKNGILAKNKQELTFTLTAADTAEYRQVANELKDQWRSLGVNVTVRFQNNGDFQTTLAQHDYDAVLDGITIGPDPDVFVYWDSSQADIRSANRLNLSEWKNSTADAALESGRTRLDPKLRIIKYKPFLQAWQDDSPALGLYQPRLLYLTHGPLAGLTTQPINGPIDRLDNAANWEIRQAKVTD